MTEPMCLNAWEEAMARRRALTVPPELIRIIALLLLLVVSLRARDEPPYSKVQEIFAALEQVSSVLQVERSDAVA